MAPHTTTNASVTSSRWLLALCIAAVAWLGLPVDASAQHGKGGRASKFDLALRERADKSADADTQKVIVTFKAGAKRGFVQALKAHGARVKEDFGIIEPNRCPSRVVERPIRAPARCTL